MKCITALFSILMASAYGMPTLDQDRPHQLAPACEAPKGKCFPWDTKQPGGGCEFCCVDYTPPAGSACHMHEPEACGKGGFVYHCGADWRKANLECQSSDFYY